MKAPRVTLNQGGIEKAKKKLFLGTQGEKKGVFFFQKKLFFALFLPNLFKNVSK